MMAEHLVKKKQDWLPASCSQLFITFIQIAYYTETSNPKIYLLPVMALSNYVILDLQGPWIWIPMC